MDVIERNRVAWHRESSDGGEWSTLGPVVNGHGVRRDGGLAYTAVEPSSSLACAASAASKAAWAAAATPR